MLLLGQPRERRISELMGSIARPRHGDPVPAVVALTTRLAETSPEAEGARAGNLARKQDSYDTQMSPFDVIAKPTGTSAPPAGRVRRATGGTLPTALAA